MQGAPEQKVGDSIKNISEDCAVFEPNVRSGMFEVGERAQEFDCLPSGPSARSCTRRRMVCSSAPLSAPGLGLKGPTMTY